MFTTTFHIYNLQMTPFCVGNNSTKNIRKNLLNSTSKYNLARKSGHISKCFCTPFGKENPMMDNFNNSKKEPATRWRQFPGRTFY